MALSRRAQRVVRGILLFFISRRVLSNNIRLNGQNIFSGVVARRSSGESRTLETGFGEGFEELGRGHFDVGDVEVILGEFGAGEDEAPMSFWGCVFASRTLGKEAFAGTFDGVAVSAGDGACKGFAPW